MKRLDAKTRKRIGRWIKRCRTSVHMSQKVAATWLRITNVHLCNLESGKTMPSMLMLERISEELSVSLPWDDE